MEPVTETTPAPQSAPEAQPPAPLIINPVHHYAHPSVEAALFNLAATKGWGVVRAFGALGVDRVRCHLASKALTTPHEWWVWVDSDMVLQPETLEMLVESAKSVDAPIMAGAVVTRGKRELNIAPLDPAQPVLLGSKGGIIEVVKAGTALMVTHRRVFESLAKELPECDYVDDESGETFIGHPFFLPLVRNRTHYGEDFTFCLRARDAGFRVYVDTRIASGHDANVTLTWADARGAQQL